MTNWNEKFNWFDDKEFAADWYNHLCQRISWEFFEKQEDMVYVVGETDNDLPKFKEGAIEKMREIVYGELGYMVWGIIDGFIRSYRIDGNVELSEEMIDWLIEDMGADVYGDWEIEARNTIVDEYAKHLGRNRAIELAKKWWGENNGVR